MARFYRPRKSHERDAANERRQAAAQATRQANRMALDVEYVDDMREPFRIVIGEWVNWQAIPVRRNIRQWRVIGNDGNPVLIDGRRCAGRDAILREASRRLPKLLGLRNFH